MRRVPFFQLRWMTELVGWLTGTDRPCEQIRGEHLPFLVEVTLTQQGGRNGPPPARPSRSSAAFTMIAPCVLVMIPSVNRDQPVKIDLAGLEDLSRRGTTPRAGQPAGRRPRAP